MTTATRTNVLENREFTVGEAEAGGGRLTWYTPVRHLKERYSSIIHTEYENTSSSAGDWDGYIIQRIGRNAILLPFSQENRHRCFTLNTGDRIASFPYRNWKERFEEFKKWRAESLHLQ